MTVTTTYEAWVGLGSSLGNRLQTLASACHCLGRWNRSSVELVGTSSVYATSPVGPASHEFFNAAARIRTRLGPAALLARLLHIEALHGRTRAVHWGDRSLDLDLLLMRPLAPNGPGPWLKAQSDDLCLPHPRIFERDFVLVPLLELSPHLRVAGRSLASWQARLNPQHATIRRKVCGSLAQKTAHPPLAASQML